MGHFISKENNLVIYDAPKTGGTTIKILDIFLLIWEITGLFNTHRFF